jgi:broad specificity phosphatase PhoE
MTLIIAILTLFIIALFIIDTIAANTITINNIESIHDAPTLYVHRHGYRLDFADDVSGQTRWKDSARFAENPRDPPLLDSDEAEIAKNAKHINGITAIYTSPFTRCIQTSIILAKILNVPIYVEYGLAEQAVGDIVNRENMDAELEPRAIKSRFPQVNVCNSIYKLEDVASTHAPSSVIAKRNLDIIQKLQKKHNNVLIVAHCGHLYLTAMMNGCNSKEIIDNVCGVNQTGTMVVCSGTDKCVLYKNGILV